jgi:hypothetical protein
MKNFNAENLYNILNKYFQLKEIKKNNIIKNNKLNLINKSNNTKNILNNFFKNLYF